MYTHDCDVIGKVLRKYTKLKWPNAKRHSFSKKTKKVFTGYLRLIMAEIRMQDDKQTNSHLSRLLRITRYLNKTNDDDCFRFSKKMKQELGYSTMGSLIATLLLQNQSILSDDGIDSLLTDPSLQDSEKPKKNNKDITILSLVDDTWDCVASHLNRKDATRLGHCCHGLYYTTQRISFLCNIRSAPFTLDDARMERILHCRADPWSRFVNCRHLELRGHLSFILAEKIGLEKFGYLFRKLQSLRMTDPSGELLDVIPMVLIFGVPKHIKHVNEMNTKMKALEPLKLSIRSTSVASKEAINKFFKKYLKYFKKDCQNQLENIRKVSTLDVYSWHAFSTSQTSVYKELKGNFSCFQLSSRIRAESVLTIGSLSTFNSIFHKNLAALDVSGVSFYEEQIMSGTLSSFFLNLRSFDDCMLREML